MRKLVNSQSQSPASKKQARRAKVRERMDVLQRDPKSSEWQKSEATRILKGLDALDRAPRKAGTTRDRASDRDDLVAVQELPSATPQVPLSRIARIGRVAGWSLAIMCGAVALYFAAPIILWVLDAGTVYRPDELFIPAPYR